MFIYLLFIAFNGILCYNRVLALDSTQEPEHYKGRLLLTSLIESNKTLEAKNLSLVRQLPNGPNIESYSGFLTIDKQFNTNLFFWFFPSFKNPKTAPLIIWLNGGPGDALTGAVFRFNGPYLVTENLSLELNPNTWVEEFSMLYIDFPVGAGFSYTLDDRGYPDDYNTVADQLYEFLQQFYELFDEYRANELYIIGHSYAGKIVPSIGYKLALNENEFNFKGIAIGNGFIDPINEINFGPVLRAIGLIDERKERAMNVVRDECQTLVKEGNYTMSCYIRLLTMFNEESMASPDPGYSDPNYTKWFQMINEYVNRTQVFEAIHVGNSWEEEMSGFLKMRQHLEPVFMQSVEPNMTALIEKYKVMLYVGNLDIICGVEQQNGIVENPEWKYYTELYSAERIGWKVSPKDQLIAGFVKSFGNFSYVIVRNAGHIAPVYQPRAVHDMIKRFITGQSFKD